MRSVEQILEFDFVKKQLAHYTLTELGKLKAENLTFSCDAVIIEEELAKTKEALRVVFAYSRMPMEFIHNIQPYLEKSLKNITLQPLELYRVGSQARGVVQMQSFFEQLAIQDIPHIAYHVSSLVPCKKLGKEIDSCISAQLEILDTASASLHQIRREVRSKEIEVRKKLEVIIRSKAEYLAEFLITIRNDRLVIPVKNSHKNNVPGIIHDQSDSMQTVYVEPQAVVDLNYSISRLKIQEREEVERILSLLTGKVREEYEALSTNLEMITELDFMFAKGQYAKQLDAYIPALSSRQEMVLPRARHPLIEKEKAVANDYHIGGDEPNMLLITGPNTGGKTVGLKTVGLLTIMAQSGLAIPTQEGAIVGVFRQFFVDIGDDQSIEQSLSTFSSHMLKLINIVQKIDRKSLVLLDEIGGGTNPNEGEAIAMALFDYFASKQALVVATTHYSNLKSYALDKGSISMTSMEFDSQTMRPTYRLLKGVFGHSYAFEISQNLGLDIKIIEQAKSYKNYYATQIDLLSEKLDLQRIILEKEKQDLDKKQKRMALEKTALETEKTKYRSLNQDLQLKAKDRIQQLVAVAQAEVENLKTELLVNKEVKLHHFIDAKKQLNALKLEEELTPLNEYEFEVNDRVMVESIRKTGKIIRKKGNEYVVDINGISLKTTAHDLTLHSGSFEKKPIASATHYLGSVSAIPLELHLIGLRVEEALDKLDKYVDDALVLRYKQVRIVHGHGTGALRKAVHQFLENHAFVKSYRLGGAGEGGLGATVVELK